MMSVLISLHALAAVIWVGGLFFLVAILRPAVSSVPLADAARAISHVRVISTVNLVLGLLVVVVAVGGRYGLV